MKKMIFLFPLIILLGCITPYANQYQELDNLYSSGQISASQYWQFKQDLIQQEYQTQMNAAKALDNINQRAIQRQNQIQEEQSNAVMNIYNNAIQNSEKIFEKYKTPKTIRTDCTTDNFGNIHCASKESIW